MIKKSDKRGLEMAISTIILIILAVILLIAIIFLFSKASLGFKDKISIYFTSSNVDSVIENCNSLAGQEMNYEYCCINKTIKLSNINNLEIPCATASEKSWGKTIQKLNCNGVC